MKYCATALAACLVLLVMSTPTLGAATAALSGAALQQQASLANSIVAAGLADDTAQHNVGKSLIALLNKPASSGAGTAGVGNAFVAAAKQDPSAAAGVYADAAMQAVDNNKQKEFADSTAQGLMQAKDQGSMASYVDTLTGAITGAGADRPAVTETVGQAMASASATVDGKEALAEATATAICKGDETAVAFSQAVSTAISINPTTGCASVGLAIGTAFTACGRVAFSNSKSFASVFNTCNMDPAALFASIKDTFTGPSAADLLKGSGGAGGAGSTPPAGAGSTSGGSNSRVCSLVTSSVARAALGCK